MYNKNKLNEFLLSTIDQDVDTVYQWQELDLSNKQLKDLPEDIGYLTNLKTLCLSHNELTTIPKSINDLINLKHLILSHNLLTTAPDLPNLTLKQLYLHGNHFYPVSKRNCIILT